MTARQNIGKALGEFLAVVLEEIAATLDRHTSRMDAARTIAPAAATEEPGRVEFNPSAPPPPPVPDDRSCPVEVRGVPCVLPMAHTGAHVDPLGAFLAPFVTVPESDGREAERMAERGLTDDQADATPVPFVDLGEPAVTTRDAALVISRNGDRIPWVERALDACHAADDRDAEAAALAAATADRAAARADLQADAAQHPATGRLRVADQLERTEAAQAIHDRLTSLLPPVEPYRLVPPPGVIPELDAARERAGVQLPTPAEVGHGRPIVIEGPENDHGRPDPENVELVQAHDSTGLECPVCFRRRHTADQAAECAGIAEAIERGLA